MSKRRKSNAASDIRWILNVIRSPRAWMILIWLGTFAVIANGLHKLNPIVRQIKNGDTRIEWIGVPDWLKMKHWRHILEELEESVNLPPDNVPFAHVDPYDDKVCSWVAENLADSPWVARVRRVCKLNDGRVRVYADFRRPYAAVERRGIAYLIDEAGVRLPEQWPAHTLNREVWFVIQGLEMPVPAVGERWPGKDLVAGLKLARFLYGAERADRLPFRREIRAIDVANVDAKLDRYAGRLRLITKYPQSFIHWGLPPGEEYGVESSADAKLAMLTTLYAVADGIPDEGPIDVRSENLIGIGSPE